MMTDAQRAVIEQVENLLIEHFDAYVLVVDICDVNDNGDHITAGSWHGGHAMAAGLCELQKAKLVAQFMESEKKDEQ